MKSLEYVVASATAFQNECRLTIQHYEKDYVLNTDQMGCEYRVDVYRTMEHIDTTRVDAFIGDMNKVTHGYTVQYTVTASGKLLPKLFICLQEKSGEFGSRVSKEVGTLSNEFGNIFVICSKFGKLSSNLFDIFTSNILLPYVESNPFLLVLDSWGGQQNSDLFQKFKVQKRQSSCTLKVIPPGCTPFAQPLDVYFHR